MTEIPEIGLMRPAAVERDAHQARHLQPADEGRAFPLREEVAVIEGESTGRDHRSPVKNRLLMFVAAVVAWNWLAVIILAIADQRPAVILARLDQVQFVATFGSHLGFP